MDAHVKKHTKEDESKANILNSIDNALNKSQSEDNPEDVPEEQSEDNPQNVPEEQSEDNPQNVPEEQSEDNPQNVPEEQSAQKQDKPTTSGENPQHGVFSDEYIDSLVQLNPDFEEESQNSEESTESTATDE